MKHLHFFIPTLGPIGHLPPLSLGSLFDPAPILDGDGAGCDGRGERPGPGAEEPNNQVRNISEMLARDLT